MALPHAGIPILLTQGKTNDGQSLTLTFNGIADPAMTYTVEAQDDLSAEDWTSIWSSTGGANVAGSVTVPDTEPVANHPQRFLRLRVGYQPPDLAASICVIRSLRRRFRR